MANSIQSTVDNGRVHLSYDGLYIDSIDSYNNWFTKLFAWAFGWSVGVCINGKTHSLNKADYAKWINSHTNRIDVTKETAKEFTNFCVLQVTRPADNASPMNRHLSASKTQSLFYKLVKSMHQKRDFEAAKKYVNKGAQLNQQFWTRGDYDLSFGSMKQGLPDKRIEATFCRYTPLLYAASSGQPELAQLMRRSGANSNIVGERFEFSRSLVQIDPHTSLEPTVELVRNRRRPGQQHGNNYHREAHLNVHTHIIAKFEDKETKSHEILYNPAHNTVINRPLDQLRTVITQYDRTVDSHKTRLI